MLPPTFTHFPVSGIWSWDVRNNRVFGDGNLAAYFSVDSDELANGLPIEFLLNAVMMEDRRRLESAVRRAVRQCGDHHEAYHVRTAHRGVRKILTVGGCQCDESGEATFFPGWFVDVTEGDLTAEAASSLASFYIEQAKSVAALSRRPFIAYMLEAVLQRIDDEHIAPGEADPS
jgi:hypothetical protein